MRFKLRAAARARYPLFVISGEEVEHLDEQASLSVVDGIVGQILSRWEERRLIEEMFVLSGNTRLGTTNCRRFQSLLQSRVLTIRYGGSRMSVQNRPSLWRH